MMKAAAARCDHSQPCEHVLKSLADTLAYLELGDVEAALHELERLAAADQLDAIGRLLLEIVLQRVGRTPKELPQISRLSDVEFFAWIVHAFGAADENDEAPVAPPNTAVRRHLPIVERVRARDFDAACALSRRAVAALPQNETGEARALLARCLELAGYPAQALSSYAAAIKLCPPSPRLFIRAGRCALRCEKFHTAERYFSIAHHLGEVGPSMFLRMATAEIGLARWPRAYNLLTSAISKSPENTEISGRLAYVELQLDRSEEALARLSAPGTAIENWPEAWLWRVEAQRRCGLHDLSFEEVKNLCDRYPSYGPGWLIMGDIALNRQDFAKAMACFERLLSNTSTHMPSGTTNEEIQRRLELCRSSLNRVGAAPGLLGQGEPRAIPVIFQPRHGLSFQPNEATIRQSLKQQFGVIQALLLREVRSRFSRNKLGYLWALIEPALQVLVFFLIFSVVGRKSINDMPLILFLTTGVISFSFLQNAFSNASDAVAANRQLLVYRRVKTFDVVISRVILQFCTSIVIFFVFLVAIRFYGETYPIKNPLEVLFCLVLLCLAGMGMGLVVNALSTMMRSLSMIFGQAMRILFFTSGIFFSISDLPDRIQQYLQYNPFLHLIEIIRDNFSHVRMSESTDLGYAITCVLVLLLFGLVSHVALRRRILAS
jgi:capsular polysaccharide transport system permease protein